MKKIAVVLCLIAASSAAVAAMLEADTAAAFQRYVRLTE